MQARCILEGGVIKTAGKRVRDNVKITCNMQNTEVDVMREETLDSKKETVINAVCAQGLEDLKVLRLSAKITRRCGNGVEVTA